MRNLRFVLIAVALLVAAALACGPDKTATEAPAPTPAPATSAPATQAPVEPTVAKVETPVPVGESLTIINDSGRDITYLYLSASDSEDWGADQLEGATIGDGESFTFTDIPAGIYDVKVEDQNNEIIETAWQLSIEGEVSWTVTGMATLEVVNQAPDDTITDVFISSTESSDWGENWLQTALPFGESSTITGIPQGTYDIKATNSAGDRIQIAYNVALSGDNSWSVVGMTPLPDNAVLRFEEEFSDNRNNWGLDNADENVFYRSPSDGEYCIDIKVDNFTAWEWYEPFRPDEFVAEVLCRAEGPDDATCGIGFGPDGDNLYWFEVSALKQSFSLFLLENGSWQDSPVPWDISNAISPTGSNMLSIERVSGVVSLYVNGMLVGSIPSDRFPTGRVGIGGSTYDGGAATVCLDDLRVWRIE